MSFSAKPSITAITQEEFNAFHQIDRTLFICLVTNLCYSPADATNLMALLLWLEKCGYNLNLVAGLLKLPIQIVSFVADECSMIWQCLQTDLFPIQLGGDSGGIPMIQNLTKCEGVDLHYFHSNRHSILPAVMKKVDEVCVRAFSDIVFPSPHCSVSNSKCSKTENRPVPFDMGQNLNTGFSYGWGNMNPMITIGNRGNSQIAGAPQTVSQGHHDFWYHRKHLSNENMEVSHPDERTIFITFCRGYPVSSFELCDYITRRFGNIIETVHMQDVTIAEPQSMYARVVVHSENIIPYVLGGFLKVKFIVNGKNVWARKYTIQASVKTTK